MSEVGLTWISQFWLFTNNLLNYSFHSLSTVYINMIPIKDIECILDTFLGCLKLSFAAITDIGGYIFGKTK